MKTRPHIVTQTRLYPMARLSRSADRLSWRMGEVKQLRQLLGYSRILIRLMKIIMDLTLHNNCFLARRQALETSRSRQFVTQELGGAPALLKWRRKNTWNKAKLAAIASGTYRPVPETFDTQIPGPAVAAKRPVSDRPKPARAGHSTSEPAPFRLPVLKNLRYVPPARPFVNAWPRRAARMRLPSIVLWPHELDGQYVPDFKNRARRPQDGYGRCGTSITPGPGREPLPIFSPP